MAYDKTTVYRVTFDVEAALSPLQTLRGQLKEVDKLGRELFKGRASTFAPKITGSERIQRMMRGELAARSRLTSAVESYRLSIKNAERAAVSGGKNIERIIKADERATRQLAREKDKAARQDILATKRISREMDKAAKAAVHAREKFKHTFLSIGGYSRPVFGGLINNAVAATLAFVSLHRIISKIGEAKDRYLRFDELTTATLTISKFGQAAFEHGSKGAERYRDAIHEAANDVKASAVEMADSALFWAKAGQTNADTIVELSKIGTIFARANRDAGNNILDQARANDILSDALQLFRKDTSTTEKAKEEATALGDKLTAAANASNIVVEQLFEYSKKVAGLFKAGEVSDEEIMAIASSLAGAGIKEESGVHVRRILTRLAEGEVQKMLSRVGISVADEEGQIRSFGDIFGELQGALKDQKPLERIAFLKDLFGQRAVATAAAMAGLNEEGEKSIGSISTILGKIQEGAGIAEKNQEQWLKTSAGRVQALSATWENAFDKMLEDSGIIEKMLSGIEGIDAEALFSWLQDTAVPALEEFGITMRDIVIPGVQMAAVNLSEWFSPALSAVSSLLGLTSTNATGLADTITTLVKLWVKWRIAMLAIRGLRMVDWLATFAKQAAAAATASASLGTATTGAVAKSKTALATLPGAFTAVGVGIMAAIAAWGLYEALVGPVEDAERRLDEFRAKWGKDLKNLSPGKESSETLAARIRDAEKAYEAQFGGSAAYFVRGADPRSMQMDAALQRERDRMLEEIQRMRNIQAEGVRKEYGVGKTTPSGFGRYEAGQSTIAPSPEDWAAEGSWEFETPDNLDRLLTDWLSASSAGNAELLQTAQSAYENALNQQLSMYQGERAKLEQERDETYEKFRKASVDDRDLLEKNLGAIAERLKENAAAIEDYTSGLDMVLRHQESLQGQMQAEKEIEAAEDDRKAARGRAFRGGKSEPINPFVTPLLSGLDKEGNRITNLALQKGGATDYFMKSPEAREILTRELKTNKQIISIHYGDASISITAKTDAKPKDIAKAVKDEWWRIGRRNQEDVQRILGATAPSEI